MFNSTNTTLGMFVTAEVSPWPALQKSILKVYPIVLITLGTVLNGLTFFIFSAREFSQNSSSLYFRLLPILDQLSIYFECTIVLAESHLGYKVKTIHKFLCHISNPCIYISNQYAAWILAFASLDRFVFVFMKNKCPILMKRGFIKIQFIVIFCVIVFVNMPRITVYEYEVIVTNSSGKVKTKVKGNTIS